MIPSNRFLFQLYRSVALLALLAVAPRVTQAVDEPKQNSERPQSTHEQAGPIQEDAVSDAQRLLEQGEQLLLEGQYAKARESFARAASFDPQDPRSRLCLAFSEFALGDFEDAATTVHDVMKMAPDLAATPLDMRGLFEIGTLEEQLAKLEAITRLQSESSRLRYLLGFVRYYSADRVSGAQTLLDYSDANPEDSTIRPFIEIAASAVDPMPQPDERSMARQSERPLSAELVGPPGPPYDEPEAAPRPPFRDRPLAADGSPREFPPSGKRFRQDQVEPRFFGGPRVEGPATLVEPRRPGPKVVFASAAESDNLEEFAVQVFCREEGLDPVDNEVAARVTDEDVDEDTGALTAEIKMHWVEWKLKEGRHGGTVRKAKPKSETIKLEFDDRGRLTDYDD